MDRLDNIRQRQRRNIERQIEKEEEKAARSARSRSSQKRPAQKKPAQNKKRKTNSKLKSVLRIAAIVAAVGVITATAAVVWATWGMDFDFADSFNRLGLNLSSVVYYTDDDGNMAIYEQLIADENRIWADYDNIPQDMKNAFVAIEDQRFYKHHGVDIKRTAGAVINVIFNGDSSYGGSTITQQLIKNITEDSERSKARKIREIVRAIILETKMDKDEILEMYMNSIYLGHGANGVQAAAHAYFGKDVKDLTLVECTAIAGITQHPSTYDPYINPEGNKEKRRRVLDKMLELDYIDQEAYDVAYNTELELTGDEDSRFSQSYFVDHLFEELLHDLMSSKGYTKQYATDLIYNGGLKIVSTIDPQIQEIMDDVYAKGNGFPKFWGSTPQSAMIITDPSTGQIKGMVGGTGVKKGARVLNRATQTYRQPGSTIKPISVYGPAVDTGVITLGSSVENSPLDINGWKPNNANKKFSAPVNVRTAVAYSYNLPAIRVLEELTVDKSFDYMTNKLHFNLVESKKDGDTTLTDKGYAPLALGGLTEGVTVMQMNAAYSTFANGGEYINPYCYTTVYDSNGNVILDKTPDRNEAFSEETAFLVTQLLKGVVQSGTAAGSGLRGIDTCGKTGSTDDNMDRWFVGYTPYYSGAVWVGYDEQKVISYGGNNPALTIWSAVMKKVHEDLPAKTFEQPNSVKKVYICSNTGQYATSGCPGVTDFANTKLMSGYCDGIHDHQIGTPGILEPEEDEEKEGEKIDDENTEENSDNSDQGENVGEAGNKPTDPEQDNEPQNTPNDNDATADEAA